MIYPDEFEGKIRGMDNQPYTNFKKLLGLSVAFPQYSLQFRHIQGSLGASPASLCLVEIPDEHFPIPEWAKLSSARVTATEDYILRAFNEGVAQYARQNRGIGGSGSFQIVLMPQQVLKRNIVKLADHNVAIAFRVSLPGSQDKSVLADEVLQMFNSELPEILLFIKEKLAEKHGLMQHCESVEDMLVLQEKLSSKGLVAFIGDGSLLPRESGESDLPARFHVVPFEAPPELAVVVDLPNAGQVRGMGIRSGITVLVGGGYHGKSTLLAALGKAVYPHVPGDGRELVIADMSCVQVYAEEGRSIKGLDISSFLSTLPQGGTPEKFHTDNASGSTSEAAAIVENVLAGAKVLLIDEDSSASNFLYRDQYMRQLIPDDPIIPLFDRIQQLYDGYGVSTVIIASGSASYFAVADQVIAIKDYLPVDMTTQAQQFHLPPARPAKTPLKISDARILSQQNFNPEYRNERLDKTIAIRIKPLRGQAREILEYGMDHIDVRCLDAIVDPDQIIALGYSLLCSRRKQLYAAGCSPTALARKIVDLVHERGLDVLQPSAAKPLFFAQVRILEVAGALNRLRSLSLQPD